MSELQSRKEGSPPACPVWVDSSIRSESDLIRPNRMHLAGKSAHNYARIFVTDQDGQSYTQLPLPSPLGSSSCRRNPVKPAPLFVVKLVNITKAGNASKMNLRSFKAEIIIWHTDVFPEAVPPATPRINGGFFSRSALSAEGRKEERETNEQIIRGGTTPSYLPSNRYPYPEQMRLAFCC